MSIRISLFLAIFLPLLFSSPNSHATPIEVDGINMPLVVSLDRRPEKDLSYSMCIGYFWNESLDISFLSATTPTEERGCKGHQGLEFDYARKNNVERIASEEGKIKSTSLADDGTPSKVMHKNKMWRFAFLPYQTTVKVPSHSEPGKLIEDSFCLGSIVNEDETGNTLDKTLIACDDCSSLQKCFETELPAKKPLSIGGKKVGAIPHKRNRTDEQYVIHETSPAKRREAPAL